MKSVLVFILSPCDCEDSFCYIVIFPSWIYINVTENFNIFGLKGQKYNILAQITNYWLICCIYSEVSVYLKHSLKVKDGSCCQPVCIKVKLSGKTGFPQCTLIVKAAQLSITDTSDARLNFQLEAFSLSQVKYIRRVASFLKTVHL